MRTGPGVADNAAGWKTEEDIGLLGLLLDDRSGYASEDWPGGVAGGPLVIRVGVVRRNSARCSDCKDTGLVVDRSGDGRVSGVNSLASARSGVLFRDFGGMSGV